jgi:hypothetical protein
MQDFKWRSGNHVNGYLTADQEDVILSLRDVPNGQTINFPSDYPSHERRLFEDRLAPNKNNRIENSVLVALTPALITAMHVQAKTYPSLSLALIEIFFCALMAASLGQGRIRSKNDRIKDARKTYEASMFSYEGSIQRAANDAVRKSLVVKADTAVRSGGSISRSTLAKLVNVDDSFFQNACDRLNVTVLQAKILLAMSKGQVKEFNIASYNSLPLAEISTQTTSRAERGDERILLNALRDQFAEVQKAIAESKTLSDTTSVVTPAKKETTSWGLTPVLNWFAKGFKGNLDVFRKVSAGDHLPAVPKSILIPEIPEAEGLDSMVIFYNTEKLNAANPYDMDHLDLPALNSWKPRVI